MFSGGPDSTDPNPEVVNLKNAVNYFKTQFLRLNADLLQCEEVLSTSLEEKKCVYIFEGVAHLVASIVIDSIKNIRKVGEVAR